MQEQLDSEKHFRVVRYYPHPGHGILTEVIAEHLTIDEAERVREQNRPPVSDEDVVIQDELKVGVDAEVEAQHL